MSRDERELRAAYYCAAALIRDRQLRGEPVPTWLRQHHEWCESALAVSQTGHELGQDASQLEQDDLIDAKEAAVMLGRSKRQAVRLANDLDGRIVSGRWIFSRHAVADYVEGMRHA